MLIRPRLRKASRRAVEIAGRSVVEADAYENRLVRTVEEVALDLDQLRGQLKVAGTDAGIDVSAAKAHQLACNAGIVPGVLGGKSVPLDLGRERRLFSDAQRTALAARYDSCATVGCDRPFAWSELHHQHPWQHGGNTDLDQALPLCSFHHRMIHDDGYLHKVTDKTGEIRRVTFRQRT